MSEKRRIQRIPLNPPVPAALGGSHVEIVDLSTVGARVEHDFPLTGVRSVRLEFSIGGRSFTVATEVVRSRLQRSLTGGAGTIVYNSGLRFSDPAEESRSAIRELVAEMVRNAAPALRVRQAAS